MSPLGESARPASVRIFPTESFNDPPLWSFTVSWTKPIPTVGSPTSRTCLPFHDGGGPASSGTSPPSSSNPPSASTFSSSCRGAAFIDSATRRGEQLRRPGRPAVDDQDEAALVHALARLGAKRLRFDLPPLQLAERPGRDEERRRAGGLLEGTPGVVPEVEDERPGPVERREDRLHRGRRSRGERGDLHRGLAVGAARRRSRRSPASPDDVDGAAPGLSLADDEKADPPAGLPFEERLHLPEGEAPRGVGRRSSRSGRRSSARRPPPDSPRSDATTTG